MFAIGYCNYFFTRVQMAPMKTGIDKAVEIAGSESALARLVGTSPTLVRYWIAKGVVSAGWVLAVYDHTRCPFTS